MQSELLSWRTFLIALMGIFSSWEGFFGSILESWSEWSRTRRWWLVISTAPVAAILLVTVVVVGLLHVQSGDGIAQSLIGKADRKLDLNTLIQTSFADHLVRNGLRNDTNLNPNSAATTQVGSIDLSPAKPIPDSDTIERERKLDEEVELLLERARSLSPDNTQIKYRSALLAAKRHDFDLAQSLMEELAEKSLTVFVPAQVWCAISMLGTKKSSSTSELELLEDRLKNAVTWKDVDPILMTVYSTMLLKSGKLDKAIQIAKDAADLRPELNLPYAQILKHSGLSQKSQMEQAAKRAEQAYRLKLGSSTELESDRINCANAILLTDRTDVAMEILREGIGNNPSSKPLLRRFFSDVCVGEYRKQNVGWLAVATAEKTASDSALAPASAKSKLEDVEQGELKWTYLLEAAKVDPDNPNVGQEIAFQVRNRQKTPQELNDALLRQLKNGSASTSCRLLVAERYLERNKIPEARMLWEQILEKDPLCLPALNNLSVMISRDQPPNAKRALELIDLAYKSFPYNAEVCDSYGEINRNLGRAMDAVSKYEEAIRIDPNRVDTRIRLAECYREAGLEDIAIEQEKIVASVKAAIMKASEASKKKPEAESSSKEKTSTKGASATKP